MVVENYLRNRNINFRIYNNNLKKVTLRTFSYKQTELLGSYYGTK